MIRLATAITAVLTLAFPHFAVGQAPAAPNAVVEWLFDGDVGQWQSSDPAAVVAVANDPNVVRGQDGGGVLEYTYTPEIGKMIALICPTPNGFAGGKSLHYWIKTTDHAMMVNALVEGDGSRYMVAYSSLPDRWQEVALDFSEFQQDEDSEDENGRLDPDQVQAIMIGDMTAFLAEAAQTEPFLIAPELGPRVLWLDDFSVNAEAVEPRWTAVEVEGTATPAICLDGFETAPLQWFVMAGKGVEVDYDDEHKVEGELSLRLSYNLPPGKIFGALTPLTGIPLRGMKRLSIAVMSETPTMLLVQLKEKDGSEYNTTVELDAGDTLDKVEILLDELTLGNDSTDENGQLDMDQVKEFVVADISAMAQLPVTTNTLWLDDVLFMSSAR